jgi:hypothetical protein
VTGLTESQRVAASLIGRGATNAQAARTVGVARKTIQRWRQIEAFERLVEDTKGRSESPDPMGTLIDALAATRDDGVDWTARLSAARQLIAAGWGQDDEGGAEEPGTVRVTVVPELPTV